MVENSSKFGGIALKYSYLDILNKKYLFESTKTADEIIANMKNKLNEIGGG